MTDGEALLGFVREAARLSPDVAGWATPLVWRGLSLARRRRIRDELLREAARSLPPVSAWAKAQELAGLTRRRGRPDASTPAGLVALALRVYPGRGRLSAAQAFRVVSCISHVEMEVAEAAGSAPMLDLVASNRG